MGELARSRPNFSAAGRITASDGQFIYGASRVFASDCHKPSGGGKK
jgi:hypothetical protein